MIIRVIKSPPDYWAKQAAERFPVGALVEICKIDEHKKTAHVWISDNQGAGTYYIPEDCYEIVFDI